MRGRPAAVLLALWACALVGPACGDAFTTGGADAGGDASGSDVSSDGPPGADGNPGGDASPDRAGDAGDATAGDGPSSNDASSEDGAPRDAVPEHVVLEVGTGDAQGDVVVGPTKTVFVTSNAYSGALGGLAGADTTCQTLATSANLKGTYKAWLSSTTTTAAARLTHSTGPYVLVNGVPIALSWTALTTPPLLAPINVNEKGGPPPTAPSGCGATNASVAWTSTNPNGSLGTTMGSTCADWTTSGASQGAVLGFADRTDQSWTAGCASQGAGSTICGMNAALYCFEQ